MQHPKASFSLLPTCKHLHSQLCGQRQLPRKMNQVKQLVALLQAELPSPGLPVHDNDTKSSTKPVKVKFDVLT